MAIIVITIDCYALANALQVAKAADCLRSLTSLAQSGQQQGGEDGDDRNYDEQLN